MIFRSSNIIHTYPLKNRRKAFNNVLSEKRFVISANVFHYGIHQVHNWKLATWWSLMGNLFDWILIENKDKKQNHAIFNMISLDVYVKFFLPTCA